MALGGAGSRSSNPTSRRTWRAFQNGDQTWRRVLLLLVPASGCTVLLPQFARGSATARCQNRHQVFL